MVAKGRLRQLKRGNREFELGSYSVLLPDEDKARTVQSLEEAHIVTEQLEMQAVDKIRSKSRVKIVRNIQELQTGYAIASLPVEREIVTGPPPRETPVGAVAIRSMSDWDIDVQNILRTDNPQDTLAKLEADVESRRRQCQIIKDTLTRERFALAMAEMVAQRLREELAK